MNSYGFVMSAGQRQLVRRPAVLAIFIKASPCHREPVLSPEDTKRP